MKKVVESAKNILSKEEKEFKRYTGVEKWLFWEMVAELVKAKREKAARGGRKTKLISREMMLMSLAYWREYLSNEVRLTYFHIANDYGISESNCWKIAKWVEDTLIKCKRFHIPGKKALLEGTETIRRINLTDGSECEIERPKKNKNYTIRENTKCTH